MGAGLFVNDLFNGEALSGGLESERGLFRKNLFDGEPLGQTTPTSTTPEITPASDSLISQLATTGGAKVSGGSAIAAPSKDGGGGAYSPYASPAAPALPADYAAGAGSSTPWVPIALIGGAVLLTVGIVVVSTSKKAATPNRRRARRNKRARRRARR